MSAHHPNRDQPELHPPASPEARPTDAEAEEAIRAMPVLPRHVAIIMDGNGRWAKAQGRSRVEGHQAGAETVRRVITTLARTKRIDQLTLYAFSAENWRRPQAEVEALMALLIHYLDRERPTILDNDIRFETIGRWRDLPQPAVEAIDALREESAGNGGMTLCLALNYGARQEIVDACQALAREAQAGRLDPAAIDIETVAAHLYQPAMPEPDLLIRTAGEQRLSNFLLWQLSYTEFVFSERYWPDFDIAALAAAFETFARRERRYGGLTESPARVQPQRGGDGVPDGERGVSPDATRSASSSSPSSSSSSTSSSSSRSQNSEAPR